jgi:Flp pilus assembly protein CpaB
VQVYVGQREATVRAERGREIGVLVTVASIGRGDRFDDRLLEVQQVPEHLVPLGAMRETDKVALLAGQGAVAFRDLPPRSFVMSSDVRTSQDRSIVERIDPVMRAMAVPVSKTTSVANLIRPADRVDVLVARRVPEIERVLVGPDGKPVLQAGSGRPVTNVESVLENVEVLAVGGELDPQLGAGARERYDTVTLHVTMEQAKALLNAMAAFGSWDGVTLLLHGEPGGGAAADGY